MLTRKIKNICHNPWVIFFKLCQKGYFNWLSDSMFLKIAYRIKMRRKLNLVNPVTYNEKLQWLKLYDRKEVYTKLVDKYEVKKIVASIIGDEYIIPTLGIWHHFDEIDFESLPDQFVLKCTHDSGGVVVCKNKKSLDKKKAKSIIEDSLKRNFFQVGREWPYKNVLPRIIAEEYKEDPDTNELRDYKFFCFDGNVKSLFIASDRFSESEETKFDFFDANFTHLPFTNGHPNACVPPKKPNQFDLMKELAAKLSLGIPQVRVDFYEVGDKVFFGEMTFFHWSGMKAFIPEEWDYKFGEYIKLPNIRNGE